MTGKSFSQALQQSKELIGFFADGSDTSQARLAKELWHTLDQAQLSLIPEIKEGVSK
jgi:hypothetical protein